VDLDPDNVEARLGLEMMSPAPAQRSIDGQNDSDQLDAVIAAASRQLEEAVGPAPSDQVPPDDQVLFCANHPDIETMLRCNRCGKPICTRCAVPTPVGYRCRQCVDEQQAVFFTGGPIDYVIAAAISLVIGAIISYIVTILGAWFIALILGPTIGIAIAEAVRYAVRRRRSRYLWLVVGICLLVGALPALLIALGSIWRLIALGLYLVLAIGAATARLR
jgi:hypothetical protein